jgi:hypothetical protein
MGAQNQLVDCLEKFFKQFEETKKRMYKTSTLKELSEVSNELEKCYDELLTLLRRLRKEQKSDFDVKSKKIIKSISTFKGVIHENRERLDSSYNYEQGVLEENED